MHCVLNLIVWEGFDQYIEEMWNEEKPVVISKELKEIIAGQTFSAKPIGPISDHIPDGFHQPLPLSFLSSYVVNSYEDAAKLRRQFLDHKEPQPSILVCSFEPCFASESYESSVIRKLIVDHFGNFGKELMHHTIQMKYYGLSNHVKSSGENRITT